MRPTCDALLAPMRARLRQDGPVMLDRLREIDGLLLQALVAAAVLVLAVVILAWP